MSFNRGGNAQIGFSENGTKESRIKRGGAKFYPWHAYKPTAEHNLFLAETGKDYAYGYGGSRGVEGRVKFRTDEFIKWAKSRDPKPGDPSGLAYTASTGKLSHPVQTSTRKSIYSKYRPGESGDFSKWKYWVLVYI